MVPNGQASTHILQPTHTSSSTCTTRAPVSGITTVLMAPDGQIRSHHASSHWAQTTGTAISSCRNTVVWIRAWRGLNSP